MDGDLPDSEASRGVHALRRSAPTELEGGGGFNFEDRVAAMLLANLLCGERPFLPSIESRILSVTWQVGEQGWRLNDFLLTLGEDDPAGSLALNTLVSMDESE